VTVVRGDSLEYRDLPGRRSADPLGGVSTGSSLRLVQMSRTEDRRAHVHPHSEEVVYVAAGSGSVWIDGEVTGVRAGDVVRIPAGTPHATVPDAGEAMELVCFFPHPDFARNIEETDIVVDVGGGVHQQREES
jgi:quercetin dioxygenase-like cupin family protein